MAKDQLWLPGVVPHHIRPVNTEILDTIEHHARITFERRLCGLHIGYKMLVDMLINPDLYWRKKEENMGGRTRVFYVPVGPLMHAHKKLARYFGRNFIHGVVGSVSTAYWRKTSIFKNARAHRYNRSSMCFDLYKAFESVSTKHVYRFLLRVGGYRPVSGWVPWSERENGTYWSDYLEDRTQEKKIIKKTFSANITWSFSVEDAWVLARLLTHRGNIRLGSPVSPILFNLMLDRLDRNLVSELGAPQNPDMIELERRRSLRCGEEPYFGLVYTRYADDLCFSHPDDDFPYKIANKILAILSKQHLRVNHTKTVRGASGVMEFPGVTVVDGALGPNKSYINDVWGKLQDLSPEQIQGHLKHLNQFNETSGVRRLREQLSSML